MDALDKEHVREAFKQEGVINIRSGLMHINFKTCFKRYSTYFFNLVSAVSISKIEKLAIHDKNNHWHLPSIVNIKVDSLNVEEANQVSAALQVEQLVEGAREYYRVKKTPDIKRKDSFMRSYSEIAKRIAKIIISPESAIGFVHGVLSVPTDIGYLAYGFLDTDSRYQRETEKIRMVGAIRHGILENHHFMKTIETVLNIFNRNVPELRQNAIYSKTMASVAGRTLTNSLIAGRLATTIAQRSSFLVAVRGGLIGNALLIGGMTERCIYTSEKLLKNNPEVYNALRTRNYDLLYFLVEPALNPFVEALNVKRTQGQQAFEKIIEMVEKEINANAK